MFEEIIEVREVSSVDRLVRDAIKHYGPKTVLISAETGQSFTFYELDHQIARVANVLRGRGIEKGETVSLLLKNSPAFFAPWLGTIRLGAVANPINLGIRDNIQRLTYVLQQAEAKLFITEKAFVDTAQKIRKALPDLSVVVIDEPNFSDIDWARACSHAGEAFEIVPVKSSDPFQMIFTSGTTGLPKAVVQHQGMLIDSLSIADHFKYQHGDVLMCVLPLFHVNAQYTSFFPALFYGGKLILFEKFSASRFFETIEKYRVNHVSVVPSLLTRLLSHGVPKDKSKIKSLRFVICGAAPLSAYLHQHFIEATGIPVANGWGMTETGCWGCQSDPQNVVLGSMGKPLPINEMRVVNPTTGKEVLPEETGKLLIRGANLFRSYYKNKQETEEAFRFGEGWFDTGDDVKQDQNGYYYFIGRGSVDTGKVDGEFVNYLTLDEALWTHPAIQEVCCVGLPDEIRGASVTACIVLKEGKTCSEEEMLRYCKDVLKFASFELPRRILFVDSIPKGDTGKIQRKAMLEIAVDLLSHQKKKAVG